MKNVKCLSENYLDNYKKKQPFRVSTGKSKWIDYEKFNPRYNLREILKDEIIELIGKRKYTKENKKW